MATYRALAKRLRALADTIDAVKSEDYSEDATELFDFEDATDLRAAAALLALAAFVGVAPDDDDGNAAVSGGPVAVPKPKGFDDFLDTLVAVADQGGKALAEAWKATTTVNRAYAQAHHRDELDALKQAATHADKTVE